MGWPPLGLVVIIKHDEGDPIRVVEGAAGGEGPTGKWSSGGWPLVPDEDVDGGDDEDEAAADDDDDDEDDDDDDACRDDSGRFLASLVVAAGRAPSCRAPS